MPIPAAVMAVATEAVVPPVALVGRWPRSTAADPQKDFAVAEIVMAHSSKPAPSGASDEKADPVTATVKAQSAIMGGLPKDTPTERRFRLSAETSAATANGAAMMMASPNGTIAARRDRIGALHMNQAFRCLTASMASAG